MSLFTESKWSDADVETVIKLIRANPVLWNSNCNEYKDLKARNAAFNAIAEELNMPADEVRKKYRNLRTQYVREVRLIKNRGYGTKWNFFGSLNFLSTNLQTNRSKKSWDNFMSDDTQDYIEEMPNTNKAEQLSAEEIEFGPCTEDYLEDGVSLNDDDIHNMETNTQEPFSKRICLESEEDEINFDKKKRRRPTLLIMKQPHDVRDEHAVLGEQVANELRALQDQPALQQSLKCSILRAILDVNKALQNLD